jgi:hypothetical protein
VLNDNNENKQNTENVPTRKYNKWDLKENAIKLLELRRDYDQTYQTNSGFSAEGWKFVS